jgi:polyhydroxybutyrate depolymerase
VAGLTTRGVLLVGLGVLLALEVSAYRVGERDREGNEPAATVPPTPTAGAQPSAITPAVTYQGSEVTGETWSGCQAGADVVFYTIEGGGHGWPGSPGGAGVTTNEINATNVIWDFFAAHPMP